MMKDKWNNEITKDGSSYSRGGLTLNLPDENDEKAIEFFNSNAPEGVVLEGIPLDINALRAEAYREEADPLFFKSQRGEIEQQVWLDKIAEIKQRLPKQGE